MTTSSRVGLDGLDALPDADAQRALLACCTSPPWARSLAAGRPYHSVDQLLAAADAALDALTESDVDAALAGHPRIGERGAGGDFSRQEQSGVDERSRAGLLAANQEYEERFGHVYLVCAAGRSGADLLAILHGRLGNDAATERRVLRDELRKINRLRLRALVGP
ncbi:MAG: 2-oxo-4-hydroxy-4-carboxy-5-ureidoimidazoline decarboxylase [Pseudonocardiales bacterium]|nr:MAG: 2-oxo-4-hydroxy-4-carboxy-5-ureidoimidazoline decarboxylase [Pseudonocardiales bacterium]